MKMTEMKKNMEEFRVSLKNARRHIESVIQDYNQTIADIKAEFPISDEEMLVLGKLGITSTNITLIDKGAFFLKTGKLISKKQIKAINLINEVSGYLHKIDGLKELIKNLQKIINAYQSNKVTTSLNISLLLFFIQYAKKFDGLSDETLSACLGMAICANLANKTEDQEFMEDDATIEALEEFYNSDGSLKDNLNAGLYLALLNDLVYSANMSAPQDLWSIDRKLIPGFASLIGKDDKIVQEKSSDINVTNQVEVTDNIDSEVANEIKKYYSNGEIVQIPEDLGHFAKLLQKSLLDEKEQKYILDLITAKVSEKVDINLHVLGDGDKAVYQQSKAILDTLDYRSPDYYKVVSAFQNLASTCSLLNGTAGNVEQVYLNSELAEIIAFLSSFIQKYINPEAETTNNLVFIGNYFADDLNTLDSSLQQEVLSLLHRIIKENQPRFRKILSSEKLLWQPFFIYDGMVSISFVEIDNGIYAILGCNPVSDDYRQIINRLLKESSVLSELSVSVKDENQRISVLIDNAEYLYDLELSGGSRY